MQRDIPVAVLEVPVLSTQWRPVRRFIDGDMSWAGIAAGPHIG